MTMKIQSTDALTLRRALQGNGIFSAVSGLAFLLAGRPLAEFIGIPWPAAVTVLGLVLLGYAASLLLAARQDDTSIKLGPAAVVLDGLWVIGTIILLIGGWLPLTTAGVWTLIILGDIVLVFALWQAYGLRQIR